MTPEQQARQEIDRQLQSAGWVLQDASAINITAGRGVAIREFPLGSYGAADYLLYVDRKAAGVIEAKPEGTTLTAVEVQSEKYSAGLPDNLPAWRRPLPFLYESTGAETQFTNLMDPDPRSRVVFSFHKPETLATWAQGLGGVAVAQGAVHEAREAYSVNSTLLTRLRGMPPLDTKGMRKPQSKAICNLERSLAENHPRALIQMTGGAGKTYTAVAQCYRLIKYAGAKRILFLVDRSNLARQTLKEFQGYTTPDDGRKFTELYNVQHLKSNSIDEASRVVITTIQRLYSILKGEPEFDEDLEEVSAADAIPVLRPEPLPVVYNPAIPIETFDFVITDECHRSIYNLWRQALEYCDAYLIGLTATPSKQTFGYFRQNLVMEYTRAEAVADGVCVDFDVYQIRTKITDSGSTVESGLYVDKRDKRSRRLRWQQLDEDLTYTANELDRSVVAEDQIRTVIRTFRDKLFTEIFPGRTDVPKTLIFAKDDSHAEDIVRTVREEFHQSKDFCQKITYRSSTAKVVEKVTDPDGTEREVVTYKNNGVKAEELLASFRNSYNPRIAVTVDMIATGTDVKPLEIVFFMRDVKSGNYFEQMNMRGSRTLPDDEFRTVTDDAKAKTRYVIVDAVGVCEREHSESLSLERQPHVSLKRLLQVISMGNTEPDVVSTLASRLSRLDRQLSADQREYIESCAGISIKDMTGRLVDALDDDAHEARALEAPAVGIPPEEQVLYFAMQARADALEPFLNPELRNRLLTVQQETEQTIDTTSIDEVIFAGASEEAKEKARKTVDSFAQFLRENRDEITALQILYSRPYGKAPTLKQLKELANEIKRPPRQWTTETLWHAYEALEKSRVRGSGGRMLTDLVSLVRFALEQETILAPFAETVNDRFARWLSGQETVGQVFTTEQKRWLEMIRDHIATSMTMQTDDFDLIPFSDEGGLGKAYALFGDKLEPLVEELNGALAA